MRRADSAEPASVRTVMLPPENFVEEAVAKGLAEVLAAEALVSVEPEPVEPENDVKPPPPRRRRDSGIISGVSAEDRPTLPYIRVAHLDE